MKVILEYTSSHLQIFRQAWQAGQKRNDGARGGRKEGRGDRERKGDKSTTTPYSKDLFGS